VASKIDTLLGGYAIGVGLGVLLAQLVSANMHDSVAEALTVGFEFYGPACAIVGFVSALLILWASRR
jgi:hypothetical protein